MNRNRKMPCDSFPMHKIRRVDRPTTLIYEDNVTRVDERESGFNRALRGEYGPMIQRERPRFGTKHPLSAALVAMQTLLKNVVDGLVAQHRAPIPDDARALSRHIKDTAYFLRADAVGICRLPSYAVYSHEAETGEAVDLKHQNAIAILVDQDWPTSHASNGHDWISHAMSFMSYSASGFIACILADYIRRLGYPARAHHARNYQVVVPPILLWAGLGEMSRIGDIVIHPFLGPRFKAAVVTTDLPLAPDRPIDFGLQDFCKKCKKCARECPANALGHDGTIMHNGYEKWPTDVRKCTVMRVGNKQGASCGTCMVVCPWNKPYTPFHRAVSWAVRRSSVARSIAIRGDDWMGYGKPHPREQWWVDLEEVDGVITRPYSSGPLV